MCRLNTPGRKHAEYEHALRSGAGRDIDAIVHFGGSAVGNTVACTTAEPLQTTKYRASDDISDLRPLNAIRVLNPLQTIKLLCP